MNKAKINKNANALKKNFLRKSVLIDLEKKGYMLL